MYKQKLENDTLYIPKRIRFEHGRIGAFLQFAEKGMQVRFNQEDESTKYVTKSGEIQTFHTAIEVIEKYGTDIASTMNLILPSRNKGKEFVQMLKKTFIDDMDNETIRIMNERIEKRRYEQGDALESNLCIFLSIRNFIWRTMLMNISRRIDCHD